MVRLLAALRALLCALLCAIIQATRYNGAESRENNKMINDTGKYSARLWRLCRLQIAPLATRSRYVHARACVRGALRMASIAVFHIVLEPPEPRGALRRLSTMWITFPIVTYPQVIHIVDNLWISPVLSYSPEPRGMASGAEFSYSQGGQAGGVSYSQGYPPGVSLV